MDIYEFVLDTHDILNVCMEAEACRSGFCDMIYTHICIVNLQLRHENFVFACPLLFQNADLFLNRLQFCSGKFKYLFTISEFVELLCS